MPLPCVASEQFRFRSGLSADGRAHYRTATAHRPARARARRRRSFTDTGPYPTQMNDAPTADTIVSNDRIAVRQDNRTRSTAALLAC